jgi:hypothetical protein
MGIIQNSIKKYSRKGGYAIGGKIGSSIGQMTGSSMAEKLGRRVGHQMGKMAGKAAGAAASSAVGKIPIIGSMKKGGPVHRTGNYLLHKGEYVLNKKKAKRMKM